MINTSNEYKVSARSNRTFIPSATIEFTDDTILELETKDFMQKGMQITDGTSDSGNFTIGSAITNGLTLLLNNFDGKFDEYDFTGAVIRPRVGLVLSTTTEWLNKGIYTVYQPVAYGSIVQIIAFDNMYKFDRPFSEVSIYFPCTALQLLQSVCQYCGVSLANSTFTNSDHVINRKPSDEALICRDIVSYVAQLSGNYARVNTDGVLELKWYDMGVFEQADNLDGGTFDIGGHIPTWRELGQYTWRELNELL